MKTTISYYSVVVSMPALHAPSPEFNFPEEPLILRLQGAAC